MIGLTGISGQVVFFGIGIVFFILWSAIVDLAAWLFKTGGQSHAENDR
ncbi:hypothetical protein [Bremerella volcania]|nr:hypothetical protein [Bremerella volcania]